MANSKTTINDLPQHILIHILTFLYITDAIGTSLVSRSFRDLWHFLPSLHFDIGEFYSRLTSPTPRSNHFRQLFVDFASKTLMFRQLNPLTKLHVSFEYANQYLHEQNVRAWIRLAVNLCVSELVLDFRAGGKFHEYQLNEDDAEEEGLGYEFEFHLSDIAKTRIEVLKLYNCDIELPPKTNPFKFVFLKSLLLEVNQHLCCGDVCRLLELCVNLEILKLAEIEFQAEEEEEEEEEKEEAQGLVIHSSSLKELYLLDLSWVDLDISCPSLQEIGFEHLKIGKFIIKDTTHLVEACIEFNPPPPFTQNRNTAGAGRQCLDISLMSQV